jgi:hypothetical protein
VSDETRPNPDALLAAIQKEDARKTRGKLKVFFGMAPGVGKTYAMLEAARRELAAGRDIVIAYVETHGRKETDALTEGLPVIPRLTLEYRGVPLTEMDLDAVLARRPQLALVDEFAHTNAPGSRHPKRYQDVLELLEAGIDVFTSLFARRCPTRFSMVRTLSWWTCRPKSCGPVSLRARSIWRNRRARRRRTFFVPATSRRCGNWRCGLPPSMWARTCSLIGRRKASPTPGSQASGYLSP